jgi:hypothetical protein
MMKVSIGDEMSAFSRLTLSDVHDVRRIPFSFACFASFLTYTLHGPLQ